MHRAETGCGYVQTFFCGGCRYRVTAYPDWTAAQVRSPTAGLQRVHSCLALALYGLALTGLSAPEQNTLPSVEDAAQVKKALWEGGIQRANKPPEKSNTPGMTGWQDMVRQNSMHLPVLYNDGQEKQHAIIAAAYLYIQAVHAQRASSCALLMPCADSDLCRARHGGRQAVARVQRPHGRFPA